MAAAFSSSNDPYALTEPPAAGPASSMTAMPYTLAYLKESLQADDSEVMALASTLRMEPFKEPDTGQMAFTYREAQTLRKAMELYRRGDSLKSIQDFFGVNEADNSPAAMVAQPTAMANTPQQRVTQHATTLKQGGKSNLAVVVDSIANARNDILSEVARLMDDKLAGLDEVIVELIRCKSENDALKQKIANLAERNETLEYEMGCFKSTGFGFYRKVGS